MDAIFSANLISTVGDFLVGFPIVGVLAMIAAFMLRGEVAILFSVYLASLGYIGWAKLIIIALFSIMLQDLFFYYLGRYGRGTRLSSWIESKVSGTDKLERYLHEHTGKALILTKYTIGFGSLTILLSGWSQIEPKKFIKVNAIADTLWFSVMAVLSYVLIKILGFLNAREAFDSIGLVLAGLVVLIFVGEYIAKKYFEKEAGIEN